MIDAKAFTTKELQRLVGLIPETDPRESRYVQLLQSIECFGAIMDTIETIRVMDEPPLEPAPSNVVQFNPDYAIPDETPAAFPEEPPAPFEEPKVDESPKPVEPDPIAEPVVAPLPEPDLPEQEYTIVQVKEALTLARLNKGLNIAQWLNDEYGVSSFSAVPQKKYGEIIRKLEAL